MQGRKRMKKHQSKILTAVGVGCAINAFICMLFAPVAALKGIYINAPYGWGNISGWEIIFGLSSKGTSLYLPFQSGGYSAEMFIKGFDLSYVNLIPHLLIIVGVVLFGVMAILDNKKWGFVCGIVAAVCFLISAIFVLLMSKFAVPAYELKEVTENIPSDIKQKFVSEGIKTFRDYYTIGLGAILSSSLMFAAFVLTATGAVLRYINLKREKL